MGKTREIFKADRDLAEGIALSPDGPYLLYSQLDETPPTSCSSLISAS